MTPHPYYYYCTIRLGSVGRLEVLLLLLLLLFTYVVYVYFLLEMSSQCLAGKFSISHQSSSVVDVVIIIYIIIYENANPRARAYNNVSRLTQSNTIRLCARSVIFV